MPRAGGLIGRLKAAVSRFAYANELRGINRAEFEEIARDLNLSPPELYLLSSRGYLSGELLEKRLKEFGLSPELVKRQHPEVLRDLQRVCGLCSETKRCAREFEHPAAHSDRLDYCPNAQTLKALDREHLAEETQASLLIGPSCC
ncbi:hypothetical protein [Bradyrhizobium sp. Ash2021]|uniref:hypothetical protein n=1 Tax=Bradyrhizobium sp. Ash2021 TaxID=2954771 RepID=UPI002815BE21|nr:hypothetical protein [Bradyrhizobium sp. Ash2021]WMT73396.1 hypothetical protein NL528_36410 [Bradyrhizobium sp. Ash2021]